MGSGAVANAEAEEAKSGEFTAGQDLSLVDIIKVFARYRLLVVGLAGSIFLGSIVYAFTATPVYRAEMMLAPVRGAPSGLGGIMSQFGGALGSVASLVGMSGAGSSNSKLLRGEAFATLTGTSNIQGFIQDLDLMPVLFSDLWDEEKGEWIDPEATPTLSDGYDLITKEMLSAEEDGVTGMVTLAVEWKDPQQAADWANMLVGNLNARLRSKAIRDTDKTIDFLNQELERTKVVELRQAIFFMLEQQISSKTSARVRDEYAFKIINAAVAPDPDKYVRPNRRIIVAGGLVGGLAVGLLGAFLVFAVSLIRKEYNRSEA